MTPVLTPHPYIPCIPVIYIKLRIYHIIIYITNRESSVSGLIIIVIIILVLCTYCNYPIIEYNYTVYKLDWEPCLFGFDTSVANGH